ncbi:MAG: autotransporter domain-containing protein [Pseudomonadota bacterium]
MMKGRFPYFAFILLLSLFPAAFAFAGETAYGWTVGRPFNGSGNILYSDDSGQNWTYQGTGQVANVALSGVFAVNGRTAYVVGDSDSGYGTIYRTTDAGATWTRLGSPTDVPDVELLKVHSFGNQKIWAVGDKGTILNSSDGGATWTNQCPAGYGTVLFQGVTTTDGVHVWATGDTKDGYATILYSDNAGANWTRQSGGDVSLTTHILGIAAADNKRLWAVGRGAVLATTDGGATWQLVNTEGYFDVNEVSLLNASTVWTAVDNAVVWSTDGGANWQRTYGKEFVKGISVISADQAWATSNGDVNRFPGTIYYTADGGATWTQTAIGPDGAGLPNLETVSMSTTTKETYPQAVENATANADAPAARMPAAAGMVKVSEAGSVGANPFGLRFYGDPAKNQLVVRSLSRSDAYNGVRGTATAGANYAIYGDKTAMNAWVTAGNELTKFIEGQGLTAGALVEGLEQGLGMRDTGTHDAIFEMAVVVGDTANAHLLRPTRNPDPTLFGTNPADYGTSGAFPTDAQAAGIGSGAAADSVFANFKAAYDNWAGQAYSGTPFPWTQLGYTYYWGQAENVPANLQDIQGMSEFILLGGTGDSDPAKTPSGTNEAGRLVAVGIYATQSYLYTKNNGITFSSAADAQYGNGFPNFNVTGPCDTLWAGADFQAGASLNASVPNTIDLAPGGSMSGGQGILVGSQNYTVTNAGIITASADTKKFNVAGSENIALLFKGDTHAAPYAGSVKNILINSGTIEGPGDNGTAVMAWAGDTEITSTGTITGKGTGYAIRTASGNDTVRIDGGAVTGHIDLGSGSDSLAVRSGGTFTGEITAGDQTWVTVDGGTLNMTDGTIQAGGITGGNAADTIILSGGLVNGGIIGGPGNDTVTLSGGRVNGHIDLGSDAADTLSANSTAISFSLSKITQTTPKIWGMQTAKIADTGPVTLIPQIAETGIIRDQDSFLIVEPSAGGSLQTDTAQIQVQNDPAYPMIRLSVERRVSSLFLVASRNNQYYAQESGNASLGAVLDALASAPGTGPDMQNVIATLDGSGDASNALKLQSVVDNSLLQVSDTALHGLLGSVRNRLDYARSAQDVTGTGISTGDSSVDRGVWAQVFGNRLRQNSVSGSGGYDASMEGVASGYDVLVGNALRLGGAIGYADSRIRSEDNAGKTDMESYQGTLYGDFSRNANYFNAALSFVHNDYRSSRNIVLPGIRRTADSEYSGQQYALYLESGHVIKAGHFNWTPLAAIGYYHLHIEDYVEKNAGDLNLKVDPQNYNTIRSALGLETDYSANVPYGALRSELYAKWLYDLLSDNQQITATFAGGGASFATTAIPVARSGLALGARITLYTQYDIELALNYHFEIRQDFQSHSGYVNARYAF